MPLSDVLDSLRSDPSLRGNFTAWREVAPTPGSYEPLPVGLDPRLARALERRGIERLYSHQAEAYRLAREGKDLVVVTPTASGKTLCYNLPVLQRILEEPDARALYFFPTKALAQDQME